MKMEGLHNQTQTMNGFSLCRGKENFTNQTHTVVPKY